MKQSRWRIGVVIPARNEEELLPRCLRSVLVATQHPGLDASVDLAVISDSSVDRTPDIARRMVGSKGWVGVTRAGSVGRARREATRVFLERCPGSLKTCWIANTDADCIVPSTWLVDQLKLAKAGIEALAGIVSVDSFDGHGPEVAGRFRSSYLIAPDGSHPHVHGANLGFRADLYLKAGEWGDLITAEDHDLWNRFCALGARRCSTARVEVRTSGRRIGRAPNGFAAALAAHNETAA